MSESTDLRKKGDNLIKEYLMSRIIFGPTAIRSSERSTQKFKEFDREKTLKAAASSMFNDLTHGVDYL